MTSQRHDAGVLGSEHRNRAGFCSLCREAHHETAPPLIVPIHYHQQEDILADWCEKNGASWTVLRPHLVMGPSLNSPMNLVTGLLPTPAMSRELGLPLRYPGRREGWNKLQETTDAELFGRATLWALGEDKKRGMRFSTCQTAMCIVGVKCGARWLPSMISRSLNLWPCRLSQR